MPTDWTLSVGTEKADRILEGSGSLFAAETGFFTGNLSFRVFDGSGNLRANARVVVDPDRMKLTSEEYVAILDDLTRWTKALYRLTGATRNVGVGIGERNSLVTANLIAAHIDVLDFTIMQIADRPITRISTEHRTTPLQHLKRFDARAHAKAFRDPRLRKATRVETERAPQFVRSLGGGFLDRVPETVRRRHNAVYEHKALLGFLIWLDGQCVKLRRIVEKRLEASPNPAELGLLSDIETWRSRIARMKARDVFIGLPPDHHLRPTNVFSMKPSYRAAFKTAMSLRNGLGENGIEIPLPVAQMPLLYELWCLTGITLAAAERFPEARPVVKAGLEGIPDPAGIGWTIPRDTDWTIPLGENVVMNYQLRISKGHGSYGLYTDTVSAVPDITISRLGGASEALEAVILDPKYRVGASLSDGIRSLHFYRDAILGKHGNRPVVGAAAIHPDSSFSLGSDGCIIANRPTAIQARPGSTGGNPFPAILQASVEALSKEHSTHPIGY